MPKEIERKYLIKEADHEYLEKGLFLLSSSIDLLTANVLACGKPIRQGYMPIDKGIELASKLELKLDFRIEEARLRNMADTFYFTVKSAGDACREEVELEITGSIFSEYWPYTEGKRIEKVRLKLPFEDCTAEIDVYTDRDLIIAEVETSTLDDLRKLPPIGLDVTSKREYKNLNLAK